jgi:3-oxoacyl-[acyl-carrier protein] reductase
VLACAIGEEDEEARFFDAALAWSGDAGLYGLINNAAIAGEGIHATFPEVDMERILRINLLGSLRMARRASRVLLQNRDGGRIVNISSIVGSRGYTGLASTRHPKPASTDDSGLARRWDAATSPSTRGPRYMVTQMSATGGPETADRNAPAAPSGHVEDITPVVSFLPAWGASSGNPDRR